MKPWGLRIGGGQKGRWGWILGAAGTLLCAAVVPARPLVVMGESMEPTLHSGQVTVLDTRYYRRHPVGTGDVVVFNRGGNVYVKRVLATAGERVMLLRYPDGTPDDLVPFWQLKGFQRLATEHLGKICRTRVVSYQVPAGHVYVVGDNLEVSEDSRTFGPVAEEDLRGRLLTTAGAPEWLSDVVYGRAVSARAAQPASSPAAP